MQEINRLCQKKKNQFVPVHQALSSCLNDSNAIVTGSFVQDISLYLLLLVTLLFVKK